MTQKQDKNTDKRVLTRIVIPTVGILMLAVVLPAAHLFDDDRPPFKSDFLNGKAQFIKESRKGYFMDTQLKKLCIEGSAYWVEVEPKLKIVSPAISNGVPETCVNRTAQ